MLGPEPTQSNHQPTHDKIKSKVDDELKSGSKSDKTEESAEPDNTCYQLLDGVVPIPATITSHLN